MRGRQRERRKPMRNCVRLSCFEFRTNHDLSAKSDARIVIHSCSVCGGKTLCFFSCHVVVTAYFAFLFIYLEIYTTCTFSNTISEYVTGKSVSDGRQQPIMTTLLSSVQLLCAHKDNLLSHTGPAPSNVFLAFTNCVNTFSWFIFLLLTVCRSDLFLPVDFPSALLLCAFPFSRQEKHTSILLLFLNWMKAKLEWSTSTHVKNAMLISGNIFSDASIESTTHTREWKRKIEKKTVDFHWCLNEITVWHVYSTYRQSKLVRVYMIWVICCKRVLEILFINRVNDETMSQNFAEITPRCRIPLQDLKKKHAKDCGRLRSRIGLLSPLIELH